MDGVLFVEFDGEGCHEGIEVCEGELDYLRTFLTTKEKGCFCVFDDVWFFLLQCSFGAGIFWYSEDSMSLDSRMETHDLHLHLTQHDVREAQLSY